MLLIIVPEEFGFSIHMEAGESTRIHMEATKVSTEIHFMHKTGTYSVKKYTIKNSSIGTEEKQNTFLRPPDLIVVGEYRPSLMWNWGSTLQQIYGPRTITLRNKNIKLDK